MSGITTQRYGTAAVAVARAHDVSLATNDLMGTSMGNGSWSIPCTAPATSTSPGPGPR